MARILVIEDDIRVAELLRRGLEELEHEVSVASGVGSGYRKFKQGTYDIVVSDVMLPDGSGFDLCRKIRERANNMPILMLTALGTTDDKLEGFDSGADDYMVKPFDFRELNARINILLKRFPIQYKEELEYDDLKVNKKTKIVTRNGNNITLTGLKHRKGSVTKDQDVESLKYKLWNGSSEAEAQWAFASRKNCRI